MSTLLSRLSAVWYSPALRFLSDRAFIQARPTFCRAARLTSYDTMRFRHEKDALDLVRDYTIQLQLRRLDDQKIGGDIAELGVYRGATSELVSRLSNRQLHLFDTFRGFDPRDGAGPAFTDTSLEAVRKLCPHARFYPGWFPETAAGLSSEVVFSMVLIDMDLEKPIAAALDFFYPRLAPGGVMIVHDYNNTGSWNQGAKKAVDAFLADKSETGVEIPDRFGSIVIIRSRTSYR